MQIRRGPGNGIQGWSVIQERQRLRRAAGAEERSVRDLFAASRGGIIRVSLIALGLVLGASLLFGANGVLRLRAMRGQVAALAAENAQLQREHEEATYVLQEDPALAMERVLREQYRKALRNEVVYQARPMAPPADSSVVQDGSGR